MQLISLFLFSFLASTILPGGSEIMLAAMVHSQQQPWISLFIAATLGNTLGAMTSYGLGRLLQWKFPLKNVTEKHQRAIKRVKIWGCPILFFSWVPVIGDPLCIAAGYLRLSVIISLIFIGAGKAVRYGLIIYIASQAV